MNDATFLPMQTERFTLRKFLATAILKSEWQTAENVRSNT
jgi:hypothetical protein